MSKTTKIRCPRCKTRFSTSSLLLTGEQVECPKCKHGFTLPHRRSVFLNAISRALTALRKTDYGAEHKERDPWITPPITSGGAGMMGFGVLIMIGAGLALLTLKPEYSFSLGRRVIDLTLILSALKRGFFFLAGILLFGFGFLARMAKPPKDK